MMKNMLRALLGLTCAAGLAIAAEPTTSATAPPGYVPKAGVPLVNGAVLVEGTMEWPRHGTSASDAFDTTAPSAESFARPLGELNEPEPGWGAWEEGQVDPATCGTCITGDRFEGEPLCADGYVDAFNGGCNSTPNVFSSIACGQTVCGTYGTYVSGGLNRRDTDWYRFTLAQTSNVTWSATGDARTRVFILQGVCPSSPLGTAVANACEPATVTINNLAPGTYYFFVATEDFTGVPCDTRYRATLTTSTCCTVPPEPGDFIDPEPACFDGYQDTTNGGCNFTPNVFGRIACGETVAGTYGTFTTGGQSFRDTDWFKFTLAEAAQVTFSARGEARTRAFILQGTCPAQSLGTAVANACETASVTLNLAPGTYLAFVATDLFSGVPCGSRYRATLTTQPCTLGPCLSTDLIEGEPLCADGYVDAFNGGCNSTPNVFGAISCGQTVCGTYGTFVVGGVNTRDTDWYRFTISQTSNVTWTATGEARTRIFILQGTCPAVSLGTAVANAGQPATLTLTNLAPGTYNAFVGTDVFTGVPCGSRYRATLTTSACCTVSPQPGDRLENEPICGNDFVDVYNGGCNSTPNISGTIECGQTIAGTYGTFTRGGQSFRDTDWYRFTLTREQEVTWTAVGSVRTRVFLREDRCPGVSLGTAVADACQPATVTRRLPAGSYYGFVATEVFTGLGCGLKYRVTLQAEECDCPADFNGDGQVDFFDYLDFVLAFSNEDPSADFNGDGQVDFFDYLDFVAAFDAGCD